MNIAKDAAVSIDYTLKDDEGTVIDTSQGEEPLVYLHGHGQIVPGLERALDGKKVGDSFKVDVEAKDGYGEHDAERVMEISKKDLPKGMKPQVGMQLAAEAHDGEQVPVWIVAVQDDVVILDGNHPLAGKTLHFEIKVAEVRKATSEELSHGHVHGEGGHHH